MLSQVVNRESARLNLPNENAVGVPGSNHRTMCKFEHYKSNKYKLVGIAVEDMAKLATADSDTLESM
jgi:hypothetical protein